MMRFTENVMPRLHFLDFRTVLVKEKMKPSVKIAASKHPSWERMTRLKKNLLILKSRFYMYKIVFVAYKLGSDDELLRKPFHQKSFFEDVFGELYKEKFKDQHDENLIRNNTYICYRNLANLEKKDDIYGHFRKVITSFGNFSESTFILFPPPTSKFK